MAPPALFLWPPQSSSAQDPEPTPPSLPKPKASTVAKKNPQRGLGVAQLERIRLQERINKLSSFASDEIRTFPVNLPSIYEQQAAPICYVAPQYRVGYWPVSAARYEQYAMDRVQVGSGSLVSAELPSNQRAAVVVSDHHCEFCARKNLLMRENHQLGFNCGNGVNHYLLMDEERRGFGYSEMMMGGLLVREREIKEYEFFPHSSSGGGFNGGDLEIGGRTVGTPSSSDVVDLSLKLF